MDALAASSCQHSRLTASSTRGSFRQNMITSQANANARSWISNGGDMHAGIARFELSMISKDFERRHSQ
jgi:hypothetical protein